MRIKVLGTRGNIKPSAPRHQLHSGVLVDNTLLFDLGETEFLKTNPKAIFLTHLHPDHAVFVEKPLALNAPLYTPDSFTKPRHLFGYTVIPIPTRHSRKINSQAYRIEKEKYALIYTGDLYDIEKRYHHLLKNCDCVVTEASFLRTGGFGGHTGIPNLIQLFKPYTNTLILTHFGSWFFKDMRQSRRQIQALARKEHVTIHIAYDGFTFSLPVKS